jgi:hypothetical protein
MPFDFKAYQQKCKTLTDDMLQLEWNKYTREDVGAATTTVASIALAPATFGFSLMGLAIATPKGYNAEKKKEIIMHEFEKRGLAFRTRKRDVAGAMALSGTVGAFSYGLAAPGAELIGACAGEYGVEYGVSKAGLHAVGELGEHKIMHDVHHEAVAQPGVAQKKGADSLTKPNQVPRIPNTNANTRSKE